jgi:hypothetical protein
MKNLALIFLFAFNTVVAQKVVLDPNFGNGGKFQLAQTGNKLTNLNKMKILPDGKFRCFMFDIKSTYFTQHNENGLVDNTFGVNGILRSNPSGTATTTDAEFYDDGSSVVGGTLNATTFQDCVIKFDALGKPDKKFGQNAIVAIEIGEEQNYVRHISLQKDDKIVLSGFYADSFGVYFPYIARLNKDGSFDPSFSSNGVYKYSKDTIPQAVSNYNIYTTITKDGKILFNYSYFDSKDDIVKKIIRFLPNGTIDKDFNKNTGILVKKISDMSYYNLNYFFDDYGNTYLVETVNKPSFKTTFTKLKPDESIDKTFCTDGVFTIPFGTSFPLFLPNGDFLYATSTKIDSTMNGYTCELRKSKMNGQIDVSFANNGIVSTNIGEYNVFPNPPIIDAKGRVVVVGNLEYFSASGYFMIRYLSDKKLFSNDISEEKLALNIYPNPTNETINIEYTSENDSDTHIEIYDVLGNLIQKQVEIGSIGKHNLRLGLDEKISTGNYIIRVSNGNTSAVRKFTKI